MTRSTEDSIAYMQGSSWKKSKIRVTIIIIIIIKGVPQTGA